MALITKILEQTLTAGQTTVVFTDTDIPNSLIRVFSSNSDIIPVSRVLSGNSLTVTYEAQSADMDVALEIAKQGLEIVDNVTSSDTDKALSAKQGKVLKDAIDTTDGNLSDLALTVNNLDIPDNITDLDDVDVSSIQDGQVLAWNNVSQKFNNVSIDSSVVYSTSETIIGKWIDNRNVYQIVYVLPSAITITNNSWTSTGLNIPNADKALKGFLIRNTGQFAISVNIDSSKNIAVQTYASSLSIPADSIFILEYIKIS